jgi:hypothetical protein
LLAASRDPDVVARGESGRVDRRIEERIAFAGDAEDLRLEKGLAAHLGGKVLQHTQFHVDITAPTDPALALTTALGRVSCAAAQSLDA